MKGSPLSDAGVGRALFTTRFRLSLQAAIMCLNFAVPAFVAPYAWWLYTVSPQDLDVVRMHAVGHAVNQSKPRRWRARDGSGERKILTAILSSGETVQYLTPPQMRVVMKRFDRAVGDFERVAWLSVFTFTTTYLLIWAGLKWLGSGSQDNKRLRGAELVVGAKKLARLIRADGAGPYRLADVPLPQGAPMRGIMASGSPGSGKSLAIHDLMLQVFARKKKALVYDQSGEFFRAHFRPGKDYFFNPAFIGSVDWSIFSELTYTYDANTLAHAFLPLKAGGTSGPAGFFEDAARALFSVILLRLAQRGARDTRDIARAILDMPADEMDHLIQSSVASSAVGGDSKQQRQGVLSSIAIYLDGIDAVKPGSWSLREFLDGPEDSRFFILGSDDTRAMFAPLYRLLITVYFAGIASKGEIVHEDRYWAFLDEVYTLGDIKLDEQLATLRKYGVSIVTGIQSESQFAVSMGSKDRAATVGNCFNSVLQLCLNSADMQESAARRLGKLEMDTVGRNQALAVTESRDGAALNKTEHEKWLVMPSDIGKLKDLTGLIKLAGPYPAARVDYRHWQKKGSGPGSSTRVDLFAPVQPLPVRDPGFLIQRSATADALGSFKAEFDAKKKADQERADAQAASGAANVPKDGSPSSGIVIAFAKPKPPTPPGRSPKNPGEGPDDEPSGPGKGLIL